MRPLLILSLAAGLALAGAAQAATQLMASQAWSRPAVAGTTAVGYVTLMNHGASDDALVGAESALARKVEIHSSSMAGGVMSMQAESRVPLPARGRALFAPGGRHLMFTGLARTLKPGDRLPATLRFASGESLPVEFRVGLQPPQAAAHGDHAGR